MSAYSPLFSSFLWLRFLLALFLVTVLFPADSNAQTPSISLTCSPTIIVAGQDVTITATISPSTATPDSDLTVAVTNIGYGITHTNPVIAAGEYQGTGTATDTGGARGRNISVGFHAPAGYSHGGGCSFTVAGGGPPPPPPPATSVTLSVAPASFAEDDSATAVTVTATASGTLASATIALSLGGTASWADYTVTGTQLIQITNSRTGSTVLIFTPIQDVVYEGDETVTISGTASGLSVTRAVLNLVDDEAVPTVTLSVNPRSFAEDDSATAVTVTATLSGTMSAEARVALALAGTATSADYGVTGSQSITVAALVSSNTTTLTFAPVQDVVYEGDETIEVSGAATGLVVISATLTLTDDEAVPTVALSVNPANFAEDDPATPVTVTATLSGAISTQTTVGLTLAGTATSADYAVAGTPAITVAALAMSNTTVLTLTPVQDLVYEGDETITVSGTVAGLVVTGTTLTLTDNEPVPTVTLSVAPASFAEDDSATAVSVTASASGTLASATIALSLGGTASWADYTVTGTQLIQITNSRTGSTVLIFTPIQDVVYEGDETVTISGTASGLSVTRAVLNLVDDEAVPTVTLSVNPRSFAEDDSATAVTVTATLSGTMSAEARVALALAGTATSADYGVAGSQSITVAALAKAGATILTFTARDDPVDETDETIEITGTSGGLSVTGTVLTLLDNDEVGLILSEMSLTVDEAGATATYTVQLATLPADPVTVNLTSQDSAIATVSPETLLFNPSQWNRARTITVSGVNDDVDNLEDKREVTIDHQASGGDYLAVTATLAVVVRDDDRAGVRLMPEELQIDEGDTGSYTLELTSEPLAVVVLNLTRLGDGVDELDWDPKRLTFAPENWNQPQTVTVTVAEDIDTADEVALLRHTSTSQDPRYDPIGIDDLEILIDDDDTPVTSATLTLSDQEIAEYEPAAAVAVIARLDAVTTTPRIISLSLAGTASARDYEVGGELAITVDPGDDTGQTLLTFVPIDDPLVEGEETIVVNGASPGLTVTPTVLTLVDDDTGGGEPIGNLSVDIDRLTESARDTLITVTLTLREGLAFDELRTFNVAVRESGQPDAVDFQPVLPLSITLLSNSSLGHSTFLLRPDNDLVDEIDETIAIAVVDSSLPVNPAEIILVDDDAPPTGISLSVDDSDITEGDPPTDITLTATVDGGTAYARTIALSLSLGGTAIEGEEGDYTVSGILGVTIPAGQHFATTVLTFMPVDDSRDELHETIDVTGSTPGGLPVTPASLTLLDNDESLLSLRAEPRSIQEGSGPVAVTLTAAIRSGTPYSQPLWVSLQLGGTALRAADYTVSGSLTVSIPAGELEASTSLSLAPIDDTLDEPEETIEIVGSASVGFSNTATVLLIDNDIPPTRIYLTASPASLSEAAPPTRVFLEARLEGDTAFSRDTRIALELAGSAVATVDYELDGLADPFVIPAGRLSATRELTLTPIDNPHPEGAEQILIGGTALVPVVSAEITLLDDDGEDLDISFSHSHYTANEYGSPAEVTITVTPAADRSELISLSVVHLGGATIDDYQGLPLEIAIDVGDQLLTFTIEALPDQVYESGEKIQLRLDSPSTRLTFNPIPSATVAFVEQRSIDEFSSEAQTVLALSARAWSDSIQSTLEERFSRARQTEQWGGWQADYQEASPAVSPIPSTTRLNSPSSIADRIIPGDWLATWRQRNERRNMGVIQPRLSLSKLLARIKGWRPVLWAEGNTHHFSGNLRTLDYQGGFQAAHVGLDLRSGKKTLLGASLMRGRSLIDYSDGAVLDGETQATLYSVHPYLHVQATDRIALWALGGFATGPVAFRELDRDHDIRAFGRLAGGGARFLANSWERRELAVRTDGDVAWIGADLQEASATIGGLAGRLRLLAEITQTLRPFGQTVVVTGEAGGRLDRGAAHRGAALEAAGRISWRNPEKGLDLSAHGQSLLWHQSSFRIGGAGIQAGWDPGAEKRGLAVHFASGRGSRAGRTRLFHDPIDRLLQPGAALDTEIELGYGTGVRNRLLTLTFRLRGLSGWTAAVDLR